VSVLGDFCESRTVLLLAILVYLFNTIAPPIGIVGEAAPLHGHTFSENDAQMLATCAISYDQSGPVSECSPFLPAGGAGFASASAAAGT